METKEILWIIAGIIGILWYIPYITQILKWKQKPQRVSWLIWAIVSLLVFFSYNFSWANNWIWVLLVYTIWPIMIFLLSIKYWIGWWTKIDKIALFSALFWFIIWFSTWNPLLWLFAGSLIDIMWFIPTIKQVYLEPNSEDKVSWWIWSFANILNLFALESFTDINIFFPPLYLAVLSSLVFILLFRKVNINISKKIYYKSFKIRKNANHSSQTLSNQTGSKFFQKIFE